MKLSYLFLFVASIFFVILAFVFQEKLSEFRSLGLLGIFLINFFGSATLFLPAPAFLSVFAGGALYPPILVAIVASLGSAGGDAVGYLFGFSGRKLINHRLSKKLYFKVMDGLFKKFGGFMLFLFALIPNPLFDSIGIFAGVFAYSPLKFFIIVFAGRFIRNLFFADIGSLF